MPVKKTALTISLKYKPSVSQSVPKPVKKREPVARPES
jgi:hypothetical protein